MVELVVSVRESARTLRANKPAIDWVSITELNHVAWLCNGWHDDPAWLELKKELVGPNDFYHSVALLTVASLLRELGNTELGNAIEFVPRDPTRQTPDLLIRTSAGGELAVEVKAPVAYRRAGRVANEMISQSAWEKDLTERLKEAYGGGQGQLGLDRPGVLVIVGFHMDESEFKVLSTAAEAAIKEPPGSREHFAGLLLLSIGAYRERGSSSHGIDTSDGTGLHHTGVSQRWVANSKYTGEIEVGPAPEHEPYQPPSLDRDSYFQGRKSSSG